MLKPTTIIPSKMTAILLCRSIAETICSRKSGGRTMCFHCFAILPLWRNTEISKTDTKINFYSIIKAIYYIYHSLFTCVTKAVVYTLPKLPSRCWLEMNFFIVDSYKLSAFATFLNLSSLFFIHVSAIIATAWTSIPKRG